MLPEDLPFLSNKIVYKWHIPINLALLNTFSDLPITEQKADNDTMSGRNPLSAVQ